MYLYLGIKKVAYIINYFLKSLNILVNTLKRTVFLMKVFYLTYFLFFDSFKQLFNDNYSAAKMFDISLYVALQ